MQLTAKELSYMSDSMKNEEMLTKLCVQAAALCQNGQLGAFMAQMAEARFDNYNRLLNGLESKANTAYPAQ